jgi:ATP-dependent Lhr-like helicase
MELFSVFMSPPLFSILHGRQELGFVDQMTFMSKQDGPRVLLLGGRGWKVNHIDWSRKKAYVEPTDVKGRTRWSGASQGLSFALCQSIKRLLAAEVTQPFWSTRATEYLTEIRQEHPWLDDDSSVVIQAGDGGVEWWTFGGSNANAGIANQMTAELGREVGFDSFFLQLPPDLKLQDAENAIEELRTRPVGDIVPTIDEDVISALKFSECLPVELAVSMLEHRLQDVPAMSHLINLPTRFVVGGN